MTADTENDLLQQDVDEAVLREQIAWAAYETALEKARQLRTAHRKTREELDRAVARRGDR